MQPGKIWSEQCEAARRIEDDFGTQKALEYLVGEKFLNYLEAADSDPTFLAEVPAFVAEIKRIFEPWQLAECPETARQTEPFDPRIYVDEDPDVVETERQADLSRRLAGAGAGEGVAAGRVAATAHRFLVGPIPCQRRAS
jgi:hypothetical protein